jgi:hypothetical protein
VELLRAHHQINMRHVFHQFRAARLRHAAEESEHDVRPLFCQATKHAHFPQCLLVSHVTDTARVQEHDVGF